jgi:hypothetical protein
MSPFVCFNFGGSDQNKKVSTLSGGEAAHENAQRQFINFLVTMVGEES